LWKLVADDAQLSPADDVIKAAASSKNIQWCYGQLKHIWYLWSWA